MTTPDPMSPSEYQQPAGGQPGSGWPGQYQQPGPSPAAGPPGYPDPGLQAPGYQPQGYPQPEYQQPGYPQGQPEYPQGYPQQPAGYPQAAPQSGVPYQAQQYPGQQYPAQQYPQQYQQEYQQGSYQPSQYQQNPYQPAAGYGPVSGPPGASPVMSGPPGGYPPVEGYPQPQPGSGYPAYLGSPQPPQRSGRKRTIMTATIAGVVSLVLVASAGAWAAMKFWFDSGDQPEQAMPASVSTYARLDLDPSLDQSVKLFNLARKFPDVEKQSGTSLADLEKEIFKDLDLKDMSYDADIAPWFGHKIGVGLWTNQQSKPYVLVSMASTDDGKAKAALKKAKDQSTAGEFGYDVKDGWALLAFGESGADDAVRNARQQASQQNLADDDRYSRLLDKMPSGQVAVGWADLDLLRKQLANKESADLFDVDPDDVPAELSGYALLAAQAGSDGLELRLRIGGLKTAPKTGDNVLPALAKMPANTAVGAAFGAAEGTKSPLDFGGLSSLANGTEVESLIKAVLEAKLVTIAIAAKKGSDPTAKVAIDARSTSAADTIADAANDAIDALDGKVSKNGTRVEITTPGYAAGSGTLGEQPLYTTTMAGMPSNPGAAVYLNVSALLDATDASADVRKNVGPLKAIGAGIGVEGEELVVLVRAVIQ